MNLYFYKNEYPNFGDDINPWFWARALNCKLDQLEDVGYLIGIGTILNDFLPQNTQLHILGSGVGYGNISPRLQRNWNVHFVRGPLTAAAIGLGRKKAVTDPVILLNKWVDLNFTKNTNFSFVPHFKIDSQKLKKACLKSGLSYVSPRLNREEFIQKIGESEKVITSAMHGAIVADALRVPWLPVINSNEILAFKWHDFCYSVDLEYNPTRLTKIWPTDPRKPITIKEFIKEKIFVEQINSVKRSGKFILSSQRVIDEKTRILEEKIEAFERDLW